MEFSQLIYIFAYEFKIYKKSQGDRKLKNNGTVANSSIEDNTVTVGANAHERNNTEGNSHSHADKVNAFFLCNFQF